MGVWTEIFYSNVTTTIGRFAGKSPQRGDDNGENAENGLLAVRERERAYVQSELIEGFTLQTNLQERRQVHSQLAKISQMLLSEGVVRNVMLVLDFDWFSFRFKITKFIHLKLGKSPLSLSFFDGFTVVQCGWGNCAYSVLPIEFVSLKKDRRRTEGRQIVIWIFAWIALNRSNFWWNVCLANDFSHLNRNAFVTFRRGVFHCSWFPFTSRIAIQRNTNFRNDD